MRKVRNGTQKIGYADNGRSDFYCRDIRNVGDMLCAGLVFGIDMPADSTYLKTLVMLLCLSAVYGVIGFIDDYIKVILKRNPTRPQNKSFCYSLLRRSGLYAGQFTEWILQRW